MDPVLSSEKTGAVLRVGSVPVFISVVNSLINQLANELKSPLQIFVFLDKLLALFSFAFQIVSVGFESVDFFNHLMRKLLSFGSLGFRHNA
jgi:hypothetical protein